MTDKFDIQRSESDMMSTKFRCSEMDEGGCELSLGSTGADNVDYDLGKCTREVQRKGKRYYGKKPEVEESMYNHLDDIKEACSGTEEGQKSGSLRGKLENEDLDVKSVRSSFKGPRKRSKKALFGGKLKDIPELGCRPFFCVLYFFVLLIICGGWILSLYCS